MLKCMLTFPGKYRLPYAIASVHNKQLPCTNFKRLVVIASTSNFVYSVLISLVCVSFLEFQSVSVCWNKNSGSTSSPPLWRSNGKQQTLTPTLSLELEPGGRGEGSIVEPQFYPYSIFIRNFYCFLSCQYLYKGVPTYLRLYLLRMSTAGVGVGSRPHFS